MTNIVRAEHQLVGGLDIANALGVTTSAVANWAIRFDDYPDPILVVGLRPVWDIREIIQWANRTGRAPAGTRVELKAVWSPHPVSKFPVSTGRKGAKL